MKERIIFMDIDGVLNFRYFFKSRAYKKRAKSNNHDMSNMINRYNLFWVGLLCKLTKAKVVLSSTWKYGWNENGIPKEMEKCHSMIQTDKLFRKFGVNIFSITRKGKLKVSNKWEIDEEALNNWCNRRSFLEKIGLEETKEREYVLKWGRGTQIIEWLERNNYKGAYIVIDDDFQNIILYKDLGKRIITTPYYGRFGGFRFKHFLKGFWLLLKNKEK